MESKNNVTYFVLLGLTQNPKEEKALFVMFLFLYILTVVGNFLIIVTIIVSKSLKTPMYLFLACLSFMDITYSSSITPRLISDLFFGEKNHNFQILHDPALYRAPFFWIRGLPSAGHGV